MVDPSWWPFGQVPDGRGGPLEDRLAHRLKIRPTQKV